MATIDPNQGIPGTDQTVGEVLGSANLEQAQAFTDFIQTISPSGETTTLQPTGTVGVFTMQISEGVTARVIDTDSASIDLTQPITINTDGGTLILGGSADVSVVGSDGDDAILGNVGSNTFFGSAGNDTIGGGAGDDIFDFSSAIPGGFGNNTITDFSGGDVLLGFGSNATLQDSPDGSGVTVTLPDGSSVFLQGVSAAQLNPPNAAGEITLGGAAPTAVLVADLDDADGLGDASDPNDDDGFFIIN
jgi:Ca2+-binding RTX toxin-like protein